MGVMVNRWRNRVMWWRDGTASSKPLVKEGWVQTKTVARKIGRAMAPVAMPEVALPETIKPAVKPVEQLVIPKATDVPDAPMIDAPKPAYDPATVSAVVAIVSYPFTVN
jgi:hypothetical protein